MMPQRSTRRLDNTDALVIADFEQVNQFIGQIHLLDAALAGRLAVMAESFQAEGMIQLLEAAAG